MKKIAKVFVSITCLVLLTVFTTGCADKVDKKTIRQEQERMVNIILKSTSLKSTEKIKKIEVIEFEKNSSTGTWHGILEVNSKYKISLAEDSLGGEIIISYFDPKEFIIDEKVINKDNNQEIAEKTNNTEIIYK